MNPATPDPLLAATRLVLFVLQGMALLIAAGAILGIPAILLFSDGLLADGSLPANPAGTSGDSLATAAAIAAIMLLVAAIMGLGFRFLLELRRVIDSVGEGDPFVPLNAVRLRRMAWLTLAVQVATALTAPIGIWLANRAGESARAFDFGFSAGGLILALVLFVLARVFRKGAEMREDLEGTV